MLIGACSHVLFCKGSEALLECVLWCSVPCFVTSSKTVFMPLSGGWGCQICVDYHHRCGFFLEKGVIADSSYRKDSPALG
jgi:hypothetical protein